VRDTAPPPPPRGAGLASPWHQQQQEQCVQACEQDAGQHGPAKQQVETYGSACNTNSQKQGVCGAQCIVKALTQQEPR
jgi:hypothetical protein